MEETPEKLLDTSELVNRKGDPVVVVRISWLMNTRAYNRDFTRKIHTSITSVSL